MVCDLIFEQRPESKHFLIDQVCLWCVALGEVIKGVSLVLELIDMFYF